MNLNESKEISYHIVNLDSVVDFLKKARKNGENIHINFEGHRLYSANVTMNSAYKAVTGKSREGGARRCF